MTYHMTLRSVFVVPEFAFLNTNRRIKNDIKKTKTSNSALKFVIVQIS